MAAEDLMIYTLASGSFDAPGDGVRVTAWGTTANNANAKTLTMEFGSTILTYSLTVSQAGSWDAEALVFSTGTDTQDYKSKLLEMPGDNHDLEFGSLTEDDGSDIIIKCTADAPASSDVVQEGMLVEFLNNP